MFARQQRQLDALRRVQEFLNANADAVGPLQTSEARTQLDGAVAQVQAHSLDQGTGTLAMIGSLSSRESLLGELKHRYLQPMALVARAKLRESPDFAALARPQVKGSVAASILAARAMAAAAAPQADAFTSAGFPADTIAKLSAAADAVQAAIADGANSKMQRVGATQGIAEQLRLGRQAVYMLDAIIRNQPGHDAGFLAAWRSAMRVTIKPAAVRAATGTPATTGSAAAVSAAVAGTPPVPTKEAA